MDDVVTVLTYSFPKPGDEFCAFGRVAHALTETWRHCGNLPTVVVADRRFAALDDFSVKHPSVQVQLEPALVPGDIQSMSDDCNSRLADRFNTEYVLIVQDDGYPLRSGLEEFVGRYDFIGAPYVRDIWWKNAICGLLGCWVQNGGFSLRSKRICKAASEYWRRDYAVRLRGSRDAAEDLFYTKVLPLQEFSYRRRFRLATNRESLRFAYDAAVPVEMPDICPFGFHRLQSLQKLNEKFKLENR